MKIETTDIEIKVWGERLTQELRAQVAALEAQVTALQGEVNRLRALAAPSPGSTPLKREGFDDERPIHGCADALGLKRMPVPEEDWPDTDTLTAMAEMLPEEEKP